MSPIATVVPNWRGKATRKLHKPNTRLQDTANEVLARFHSINPGSAAPVEASVEGIREQPVETRRALDERLPKDIVKSGIGFSRHPIEGSRACRTSMLPLNSGVASNRQLSSAASF